MRTGSQLQFSRTDDHLARHAVGVGTRNAVHDGRIGKRLDEHRREGRTAAADRPGDAQQRGIDL